MAALRIRAAEHPDADRIFALLEQFAVSYTPDRASFERHFPLLLESGHTVFLVAESHESVVGYALAFHLLTFYANGPITELQELMVDPAYRGQGIGMQLVEAAADEARSHGSVEMTAPTRRAGYFYKKLGFEETAGYFKRRLSEPHR